MDMPFAHSLAALSNCCIPPSLADILFTAFSFLTGNSFLLIYVLPLAVALLAITLVVSRLKLQDSERLERELRDARELAQERERERDL
jgi:hypothetical protein